MARDPPDQWDVSTDVTVVGSGAAGLVAALAAAPADVVVVEKSPTVGGTTAVSGGGLWLPNSRPVVDAVGHQSPERVRAYIRRVVGDRVADDIIDTFVDLAPAVLDFIEAETNLEFQFAGYPDYHTDWEEASDEGNMVEPRLFDGTRLGDRLDEVRTDPHHTLPVPASEVYEAGGHGKFPEVADFDELTQRKEDGLLATGRALVAGLYEACLEAGVQFELDAPAKELVDDDGRVVGLVFERDDTERWVEAHGTVIAAGGMEWDEGMRKNFLRGPVTGPATPPELEGDGIKMGMDVGADLGNMNEAWWFPTGHVPGETWEDGSPLYRMVWGRTLPGSIMVNREGDRFCNKAGNYHDLGKTFHDFDPEEYGSRNVPAYLVVDDHYRSKYRLLSVGPGDETPDWIVSGETIRHVAEEVGIDPDGLADTVETFNKHARAAKDPEFGRGETAYDRYVGDPDADHPNLAPLDEPPFYAMEVHSGVIGTKGGLVTDPNGTVQDVHGDPIAGLYAASNSTAHVMGMGYAGAGATLGPNVVFGYQAGRNANPIR
jgi:succinate dehydrogenase/fumarate reductase flavoprotein subunit